MCERHATGNFESRFAGRLNASHAGKQSLWVQDRALHIRGAPASPRRTLKVRRKPTCCARATFHRSVLAHSYIPAAMRIERMCLHSM